ncbi:MAG: tetratricopeptide repeat protein [Candidatus Obscuribacterales bacterium]
MNEKLFGPRHKSIEVTLQNIATLYVKQHNYEQAEVLYEFAIAILVENLGQTHPLLVDTFKSLTGLYRIQGKFNETE